MVGSLEAGQTKYNNVLDVLRMKFLATKQSKRTEVFNLITSTCPYPISVIWRQQVITMVLKQVFYELYGPGFASEGLALILQSTT